MARILGVFTVRSYAVDAPIRALTTTLLHTWPVVQPVVTPEGTTSLVTTPKQSDDRIILKILNYRPGTDTTTLCGQVELGPNHDGGTTVTMSVSDAFRFSPERAARLIGSAEIAAQGTAGRGDMEY